MMRSRVSRRVSRIVILSIFISLLIGLSIFQQTPSRYSHDTLNTGFDGLYDLWRYSRARLILSLEDLARVESARTLLIIARDDPLNSNEINEVIDFARRGGLVIAYGSREFVNELLKQIVLYKEPMYPLYDVVSNKGSKDIVRAFIKSPECGVQEIVLEDPYSSPQNIPNTYISSSSFAYLDLDENGYYDLGEPQGVFSLATRSRVGEGEVIIIFSKYFLENSLLSYNVKYFDCLRSNRSVVIDQSFLSSDPAERFKHVIRGGIESTYVIILLGVLLVISYYARER